MERKAYYFARGKMNFPDIEVPGHWEQFQREQPYQYEINLSISREEILVEEKEIRRYGRANVIPYREGWLFITTRSNWQEAGIRSAADLERLERKAYGRLYVSRDYRDCVYYSDKYQKDTIANLHTAVDAALPLHGGSIVHASCIKHRGKAILFCGPSGMGKSTQARLWQQRYGAYMLSSDAPAVFPGENGAVAYGMPWDGSDQIMTQESAPVAAVIELAQAKENRIRPMSGREAMNRMMQQGHLPMWDEETMVLEMQVLKRIAQVVPFYHLDCLPDEAAAELVHDMVFPDMAVRGIV